MEELEGTVEQAIEAGASILDNLEEGSRKALATSENARATAQNGLWVVGVLGLLGLGVWALYWKTEAEVAEAEVPHNPAPATTAGMDNHPASLVLDPHKPKKGIRNME